MASVGHISGSERRKQEMTGVQGGESVPKGVVREDRESLTAHRSCCTDTLFPPSLRNVDGAAARGRRQGEFRGTGLAGRASRCATALGDLAGDTSLAYLQLGDVLVVENNVPVLTCQWAGMGGGTRFKVQRRKEAYTLGSMHLVLRAAAGFTLFEARISKASRCSVPTLDRGATGVAAAQLASMRTRPDENCIVAVKKLRRNRGLGNEERTDVKPVWTRASQTREDAALGNRITKDETNKCAITDRPV